MTLVEHALCPLDASVSLKPNFVHETTYLFTDGHRNRRKARVKIGGLEGMSAHDELYLWGLLSLALSQPESRPELMATPYYCLRHLGMISTVKRGGREFELFRAALKRLAGMRYQNDAFYDPVRGEHRAVSFGLLNYSLPLDSGSSRAWRFAWDPIFFELAQATGGALSFDLALYRQLDAATRRLYSSSPATVQNNIFWADGSGDYCLYWYSSSHTLTSDYNLFYVTNAASVSNYGATLVDWQAATGKDPNSQTGDPLVGVFADWANRDFHLLSTTGRYDPSLARWDTDAVMSPAVDTGNRASSYANEPIPKGFRVNIGAYGDSEQASMANAVILSGTAAPDVITFTTGVNHLVTINDDDPLEYDPAIVTAVIIDALEGNDSIVLTGGAGNEEATLNVGSVELLGPDYEVRAASVEDIRVFAGGGAYDEAYLIGAYGDVDEIFVGREAYSSLRSDGLYEHRVDGFNYVEANVTHGTGTDKAYLYDTESAVADDTFYGQPEVGRMVLDSGQQILAMAFDQVKAYSSGSLIGDRAYFYGADGADRLVVKAKDDYAYLQGEYGGGYYNYAEAFDYYEADVASGIGGLDQAMMYGSAEDDTFSGSKPYTELICPEMSYIAYGFGKIKAYGEGSSGGDTATLYGSEGDDQFVVRESYGYLEGKTGGFEHYTYTKNFDLIRADVLAAEGGGGGGDDRAYMYDTGSAGESNDTLYGYGWDKLARLELDDGAGGTLIAHEAKGFDRVKAFSTAGADEAYFEGSDQNDLFNVNAYASPNYAYIQGRDIATDDMIYYFQASDYAKAEADASVESGAGDDRAVFVGTDGDDTFNGYDTYAEMIFSAGIQNKATGFDRVTTYGKGSAGNDLANLYGSAMDDTLIALRDTAYMKDSAAVTYYNYAKGFDKVFADVGSAAGGSRGGTDVATLWD